MCLLLPSREDEHRGEENSTNERDESHYSKDGGTTLLNTELQMFICKTYINRHTEEV